MESDQPTQAAQPRARSAAPRGDPLDRGHHRGVSRQGYIAERSLATTVFLALELGRPAAARGRGGRRQDRARQGPRGEPRLAPDPAPVLRGPRRQHRGLRVELPAPDARDPAARGPRRDRQGDRARHLRPRVPAQAAAAPGARGHRRRRAGPADRRDRPRRRGVRGVPARDPVRLPGHGPRDRHDPRRRRPPRVVLTSNRTREVHDALKRRCLYHWIDYPTASKEFEIVVHARPRRARRASPARSWASSTGCAPRT